MQVPPPALGVHEPAGHRADLARHVVHLTHVRRHVLRVGEKRVLAAVRGKRFPLDVVHPGRVDERAWHDAASQRVAQSVRHRVIDGDVGRHGTSRGRGAEVWHAPHERGSHGQPARLGVVLHVVLRRRHQQHTGTHCTDDGRDPAQQRHPVQDRAIGRQARMKPCPEDARGGTRFPGAQPCGRRGPQRQRSARAVGNGQVVRLPARLGQAPQRARHEELDVVGMGRDGHRDVGGRLHHDRCTGRPSRADW